MNTRCKKIAITGPESTGKSTLTVELAQYYQTNYIPEYAREYIEKLSRPYNYSDLELIAQKQVSDLAYYENNTNQILFLDTYLIITKVWFDVVYNKCPWWIIEEIQKNIIDLYLLCDTDLPWVPDAVRENGGKMREVLFQRYLEELEKFKLNYRIIRGLGSQRLENAIKEINTFLISP